MRQRNYFQISFPLGKKALYQVKSSGPLTWYALKKLIKLWSINPEIWSRKGSVNSFSTTCFV